MNRSEWVGVGRKKNGSAAGTAGRAGSFCPGGAPQFSAPKYRILPPPAKPARRLAAAARRGAKTGTAA